MRWASNLATAACGLLVIIASVRANGAPVTIINGSFENGNYTDNGNHTESLPVGSTDMTGWTVVGGELAWARNDNPFVGAGATSGNFFLDLTGFHDSAPYGGVSQTIDTVAGTTYGLGFDLGTYQSDSRYMGPVSVTASAGATSQVFTFTPAPGSLFNQHGHFTLPFTATSATTIIMIQGTSAAGGQYLGLDNITIPEPGGAMLGMGCLLWGMLRRGRRRLSPLARL